MINELSRLLRRFACLALLSLAPAVAAQQVTVNKIRAWPAPDQTRVVFDLSGPLRHTLFMLKNPDRVVIDLRNTRLRADIPKLTGDKGLLSRIRAGSRSQGSLRVVFDLREGVRPRSFLLKPNSQYGHRLVIDLQVGKRPRSSPVQKTAINQAGKPRDLVIALDPGHGGEDPGAIGSRRTREKNVVLALARRLQQVINREPGMRAVLTRKGDYYLGLRKRMEIARGHGADLFLSLHADAFQNKSVQGSSVYILSRNGASSEAARWLAEQENAADLVGGVSLDDKDEVLASVLLDLSQTATISASTDIANQVLKELKKVGKVHKPNVERAGFMVLKSPDIPSMLIETAYLSNPKEEKKLTDNRYISRLSKAILRGIKRYFSRSPPPGTLFAARQYIASRGDTLSQIATRYGVSLAAIKTANNLNTDLLRVGQVLRIPAARGS